MPGDAGGERRLRRGDRSLRLGRLLQTALSRDPQAAKPAGVEEVKTPSDPPVRHYDRSACFDTLERRGAEDANPLMPPVKCGTRENRNRRTCGRRVTGTKKLGSVTRRPVSFILNKPAHWRAVRMMRAGRKDGT